MSGIALPEDDKQLAPRNVQSKIVDASPPAQTVKRIRIILEEDPGIPPVGLFICANGKTYMLMAGVEASVPREVISVLDDAVVSVPTVNPIDQRVTGYRERLRFPYRRLSD